jgi:hypothetical protein
MDKIVAAAIERLEAEKQLRIDEKVAKGEAVRVQIYPVLDDPEEFGAESEQIESAKADKLAELRAAGETREIIFYVEAISTGVPRSKGSGEAWPPLPPAKPYDRYAAASDEPRKPAITRPSEEPAEPLEEHRIRVQVAPPTENDPGAIVEGSYTLGDGVVRVYDADHNLLGTEHLRPGDDGGAAARRVLREKKGPDPFWNPIPYGAH